MHPYFEFLQCIKIRSLFITTYTKAVTWPLSSGKLTCVHCFVVFPKHWSEHDPSIYAVFQLVSVRFMAFRTHIPARQTTKVHNTPLLPRVYIFLEPSVLSIYNINSCVILLDVWECFVDWKQGQSKSFIYSTNIRGWCGIRRRYRELPKVNSIITEIINP